MLSRIVFDAGRVVRLSFDKFLWFPEERAAIFEHFEIEKMGQLAVRRSIPVGRSGETWTNSRAFGGWLNAGADGTSLRVDPFCPIQFFGETNRG